MQSTWPDGARPSLAVRSRRSSPLDASSPFTDAAFNVEATMADASSVAVSLCVDKAWQSADDVYGMHQYAYDRQLTRYVSDVSEYNPIFINRT